MIDINTETKLLKALNKILNEATNPVDLKAVDDKPFGVMDCANVCMIVAKTKESKRILCRFKEKEEWEDKKLPGNKIPELDYNHKDRLEVKSAYSSEYLKPLIDIITTGEDKVTLQTGADFPLTLENEHFRIILAPRVDND